MASRQVGDKAARTRTVREQDIELFTELTGDRNPLHYDERAAAESRFGGIIVQGGVTSGLLNAVVAEDLPGPGRSSATTALSSPDVTPPCTMIPPKREPAAARSS